MNIDNNNIDKYFREGLDSFEPEIPDYVWSNIHGELKKDKRDKFAFYFRNIAAAILILFAFGAGYYIANVSNGETNLALQTNRQDVDLIEKNNVLLLEKEPVPQSVSGLGQKEDLVAGLKKDAATISPKQKKGNSTAETNEAANKRIKAGVFDINPTSGKDVAPENISVANVYVENKQDSQPLNEDLSLEIDSKTSYEELLTNTSQNKSGGNDNVLSIPPIGNSNKDNAIVLSKATAPPSLANIAIVEKLEPITSIEFAPNRNELLALNTIPVSNMNANKTTKWEIGGMYSPVDFAGYASGPASTPQNDFYYAAPDGSGYEEASTGIVNSVQSIAGGLSVAYKINKKWGIRSGLVYSKHNRATSNIPVSERFSNTVPIYTEYTASVDMKLSGESNRVLRESRKTMYPKTDVREVTPDKEDKGMALFQLEIDLDETTEYIEIPMIAEYKAIDRKVDLNFVGGFNTGILVSNSAKAKHFSEEIWDGKTNNINKINYAATMGIGLEVPLAKRLALNLEPRISYYLNDKSENHLTNKPYAMSVFSGISYMF